ncbi:hypothetical protein FACS1894125_5310 [Actinomycetota bacterium]|nr:hypothetical protein FACS1894125_5310 [Actinomycetota bacterium]
MATHELNLKYSGTKLETGIIPAHEFATSLLAFERVVLAAQSEVDPTSSPVQLEIKAIYKGSFDVTLILANAFDAINGAVDLLNSNESNAITSLIEYAGVIFAAFKGIKKIKGRKYSKKKNEPDKTILEFGDEEMELDNRILKVIESENFRQSAFETIAPISSQVINGQEVSSGIDKITLSTQFGNTETIEDITKDDFQSFSYDKLDSDDNAESIETINESEVTLEITKIDLRDGKWKVSDGSSKFGVTIEDSDFMSRVHNHKEVFGAGDTLRVKLRNTQSVVNGSLKSDKSIMEVLDHKSPENDLPFDMFLNEANEEGVE